MSEPRVNLTVTMDPELEKVVTKLRQNEKYAINSERRAQALEARDLGQHPAQQAALQAAVAYRLQRKLYQDKVADARERGLKFLEVGLDAKPFGYRVMTVAYLVDRRDVISVSTALFNPGDQFDKLEGRYVATCNFNNKERIRLRKPGNKTVHQYLHDVFFEAVAP
jgi:hypothetical protein